MEATAHYPHSDQLGGGGGGGGGGGEGEGEGRAVAATFFEKWDFHFQQDLHCCQTGLVF